MGWECLPYTVCYEIFQYFDYKDLVAVSGVCFQWFTVSRDERLWKKVFFSNYKIDDTINNRGLSWFEEFRRLHYNIPCVQTEVIHQHFDQVLHVTFSHNGQYFVTCSRDCLVMIWKSSHPAKLKESLDMSVFHWRCAHYSEFNSTDSLLLVSGITMGPETSTCGEIIVFYVEDFLTSESGLLQMKCRIDDTPYSLFGTWFNESLLLSGNRFWLGGYVTATLIYMNRASQETSSEHIPVTQGLFKFYNTNRSSITSLLVAKCLRSPEMDSPDAEKTDIHFDKSSFKMPTVFQQFENEFEYEDNIMFNRDESDMFDSNEIEVDTSISESSSCSEQQLESEDKYLIYITGSNTFIPHEVGIKRIRAFKFPERIDPGPSLKERQMLLDERKRLLDNGMNDIRWIDFDSVAETFDAPDHLIDLHGHILGMRLSPDQRFLYVTVRIWPEWEHYNFYEQIDASPAVQNDISLTVIDLATLEIVGVTTNPIRKTYSTEPDYYFIYMDVSEDLVVSTGRGPNLHVWDRHFGIPAASLTHKDVVNGAAFNPKDPEMMVSVSDDSIIKIWRSRAKVKEMNLREKSDDSDTSDDSFSNDDDESETSE
ncbi:hypothetical protein HHI36_005900 [Cryptolaemus montrouzieri]|uniref:F-box domain-containing protein n=1 Tax=Cryptolaemus montrouzieri TaxID=559131 RepID=A0ABD2NWF2_9CUCU